MRLSARISFLLCVLACTAASAQSAAGFNLNRFDPAARGSDWFNLDSLDFRGHKRPAAGLTLDYAYRPLVIYNVDASGNRTSVRDALVSDQFFSHVGAAFILKERFRFGLSLPMALTQQGKNDTIGNLQLIAPTGASLGDVRIDADARLIGSYESFLTLAAGIRFYAPTGNADKFTSDGSLRMMPHVMAAGHLGPLLYAGRVAVQIRPDARTFVNAPNGHQALIGLAVGLPFSEGKGNAGLELTGSTLLNDPKGFFAHATSTPAELLVSAHYTVLKDFKAGLGAGPGLSRGLGAPALRVVASLDWMPHYEEVLPVDSDGDGIVDGDDACPTRAGVSSSDRAKNGCPPDRDNDGIADAEDACPDEPGLATGDPKTHGCPAPDSDHDGIADSLDACPEVAGVPDSDAKKNGCPPDSDNDGIIDAEDACPKVAGVRSDVAAKNGCPSDLDDDGVIDSEDACVREAGVRSTDVKKNGCPADRDGDAIYDIIDACPDEAGIRTDDPKTIGCPPPPSDRDADGVVDAADACPDKAGVADKDPKKNGCPIIQLDEGKITIFQQVQFATGSATILPESDLLLQAVANLLLTHPTIKKVRVEGHTDNRGKASTNLKLSQDRAASVVAWLVAHNIAAERLLSEGFGLDKPIASNSTEKGRKVNRRVEFVIIDDGRAPAPTP